MSENKKNKQKNLLQETNLKKKKKSQIDALDRFDQQFQNIRKEKKKQTFVSKKFPRVVYQKKILEHTTLSFPLLHSAGLILFNFNLFFFEISKK